MAVESITVASILRRHYGLPVQAPLRSTMDRDTDMYYEHLSAPVKGPFLSSHAEADGNAIEIRRGRQNASTVRVLDKPGASLRRCPPSCGTSVRRQEKRWMDLDVQR